MSFSPSFDAAARRWVWAQGELLVVNLSIITFLIAVYLVRTGSQTTVVCALMFVLLLIGLLMLLEVDRSVKANVASPLPMHAASLLFGVVCSSILSLPRHGSVHWVQPLSLFVIQAQIYFMLLGLSSAIKGREQSSGVLAAMLMTGGHMLAGTFFDAHLLAPQIPALAQVLNIIDFHILIIIFCGFTGGSTAGFLHEHDPIPLERKYVVIWVALSIGMLFTWWLLVAR